jgi:hypothetical protein
MIEINRGILIRCAVVVANKFPTNNIIYACFCWNWALREVYASAVIKMAKNQITGH